MKFACFSDTHLTSSDPDSDSLFTGYFNRFSPSIRKQKWEEVRIILIECVNELMRNSVVKDYSRDAIFHLGDMTGGWHLNGLNHPTVSPLAEHLLDRYAGMTNYVGVCWGNHDVGYRHKKLNFESLVKCHQLSPLFWWHPVGGILFLGICSPLLDQYEGEGEETVNMLALEQVSLIEEVLRKNRNEKWILCTHDLSVDHLDHYVGSYKKNLVKVISGHVHSTRGLAMEKIKGRFGSSFSSYCRRLLVGCPAVAPLWWHGGSCLTGEVLGERVSVNTHLNLLSMELQDRIKKSPFNTFLKCVLKSIWDVPRFREVLSK